MATAAGSKTLKTFRAFTAVDLVTLAALAALFRAFDYLTGVVAFIFPFNTLIMTLAFGLTAMVAASIIRKTGVFTMFTIAAQLINFFVQGETLVAVVIMAFWGILADVYVYMRLKSGADPFTNYRDMVIAGLLLGVVWVATTYGVAFPLIFLVNLSPFVYGALMVLGTIGVIVGGILGFGLGNKIKGLLG